ncbi:MAG TPA: hypothetical protein DD640_07450 [Clostridiales bacterium]|nr:hypothetical protein [Clostridiales bacterium]
MKKNQAYIIQDYGRDRAVPSPNRSRRSGRRRNPGSIIGIIIVLALLAVLIWQSWPYLPWPGQSPTSSAAGSETTLNSSTGAASPTASASETEMTAETTGATAAPITGVPPATVDPSELQVRMDEAGEQALALLAGKTGRFSIYCRDLQTGDIWQYNETAPFVAASSIKLGINTYLYTQIAAGSVLPDEMLAYDNRNYPTGDYESGTGTIQYLANGSQMTVRETSGLSIRISDNCGTNMIIRRLGGIDAINPYLREVSGAVDYRQSVTYKNYAGQTQSGRHRTCALDLGSHAVWLYQNWQASPQTYQPLIDDLCQTEFDFGIQKGIPETVPVAHKIGTNGAYSAENDVGIVLADRPFVLCVMTEMASAGAAHTLQADLAAIFYAAIQPD